MSRRDLERFRLHHTGFVFQGFNLFPALTALEQVQLPLGYLGMRDQESARLASRALDEVGLSHRAHMRPAQLSGGEKQRVAIARAIARSPSCCSPTNPPARWTRRTANGSWTSCIASPATTGPRSCA